MRYKSVELHIDAPTTDVAGIQAYQDVLAALLGDIGFESFEETASGMTAYIPDEHFDAIRLEETILEFPFPQAKISYEVSDVEERDWNAAWEEAGFSPIIINDTCVIHDNIHLPEKSYPIDITIEACQSFGTGTHATTRMIATELLGLDLTDKRVLDCGCGTGILSLLAKKAGAKEVVAYDIDEWSVNNIRHNMDINQIEGIDVLLGDRSVLSHVSGFFDIVMANINRNVLLADMPHFREVLSPDGLLILSGFYEHDAKKLCQSAAELNLTLSRMESCDDWCMLLFSPSSSKS